jgi:heat shock protein HslJ
MKYLFVYLSIILMSCADKATDTNAQSNSPTSAPTASTPARVSTGPQASLTGTYWKLLELNGKNMEGKTAKEMYLTIDPSSPQVKSHSGCSLVMAEAKTSGTNQLWFINLLNTTGECKTPDIDAEFIKAMEGISQYDIDGNILILSKGGAEPTMKFMAKA